MSTPETRVIAGRNPVREALQQDDGRIEKVLVQQGGSLGEIRAAAKAAGVPVQTVPQQKLDRLAPKARHQGVVAIAAPVAYADVAAMLHNIAADRDVVRATKPILVALDEIEDPHNFGAILRSAVAAGASGVLVPERRMAPLSAVTVKASAGGALRIPIARVPNLAETLLGLKERSYWIAGLAGEAGGKQPGTETVWAYDWDRPVCIVVGNEGRGLRERVRSVCDTLVSIPMRGPMESLNASVAAGIALFAAARTRDDGA
ncbi:MAG: 23S rRNA (guanosine(2251)-2'-O)-methyltransferase RlmB [Bacteroidota bacterium]